MLKVWLYAAAVVAAGAWASPLLYDAGKALGEVTSAKRTNGFLTWLGTLCREAPFPAFFIVTVVVMALLLFIPFVEWLDMKRAGRGVEAGQRLRKNPKGLLQWGTGFLMASGLFLLMGYGLVATGSFMWEGAPPRPLALLRGALSWALAGIVLQEWLFRGVALGIFLRAMKPLAAIALAAILFAAVGVIYPSAGLDVRDPDAAGVGFELLGLLARRLGDPVVLAWQLLPLVTAGWVLGYARWRTASLWLPVGLQMGWLVATALFQSATKPLPRTDPLARLLAGDSLMHGFIPLACMLVVGALVYFVTEPKPGATDDDG